MASFCCPSVYFNTSIARWLGLLSAVIFCVPVAAEEDVAQSVTLTVANEPAQSLAGFGCSMVDLSRSRIPAAAREELFDRVFGDLHMNVLRLWADSGPEYSAAAMRARFYRCYVDSNVISDAQRRGVKTLLLAPTCGETAPTQPIADYARKLADFIQGVQAERGITINVTGVANEPAGFTPEQMAEAVRSLQRELDRRGLQKVQIIAPEWASADDSALRCIAALRADPLAWNALGGIATHSYNMAATPRFAQIIAGTNKQYWITEAADNGNESESDGNRAATIAGRFLNDLNNGVTHWIYFIGFHDSDDVAHDNDNATKLLVYDLKRQQIFRHLKYDWFRQLREAFPNGSRIYPLRALPGGDLAYSYGQKPLLNAAAARRPDGGWSLAAVNLSGVGPDTDISKWHPATTLSMTWRFNPPAGDESAKLRMFRSDAMTRFAPAGQTSLTGGTLAVTLKPGELVTLAAEQPTK